VKGRERKGGRIAIISTPSFIASTLMSTAAVDAATATASIRVQGPHSNRLYGQYHVPDKNVIKHIIAHGKVEDHHSVLYIYDDDGSRGRNDEQFEALVKKQFAKLAMLVHPDRNTDPEAVIAFRYIRKAKKVLMDEIERRRQLLVSGRNSTPVICRSPSPLARYGMPQPPPEPCPSATYSAAVPPPLNLYGNAPQAFARRNFFGANY
jgi:hypothetical protein